MTDSPAARARRPRFARVDGADPAFLSLAQVADLAGIHVETLRQALKEGRCPLVPEPTFKAKAFSAAQVRRWLNGDLEVRAS